MIGPLLLGQTTFHSKSIPAPKSQHFVDISRAQKPTWAKFWEFDFFIWKRQGYADITGAKNNFGLHHLHTQILQRNCRWNCRNETKNKSEKWNFWEAVSHFVFDITFRIFLLWESYHWDKMIKSKKVSYF